MARQILVEKNKCFHGHNFFFLSADSKLIPEQNTFQPTISDNIK